MVKVLTSMSSILVSQYSCLGPCCPLINCATSAGVNIHHVEFEGRATWGKTMPKNDVDEDGNGTFTPFRDLLGLVLTFI